MLAQLTIKNFGLIDELTIEFPDRLAVLTGETGAGKSIIIDALRYVLGERLDPAQVRSKDAPCSVEAVFALDRTDGVFADFVSSDDPTLIISRSYLPDGKTRIRVNGAAVTVAQLRALGDGLVDFHGPNDHQMLLDASSHLGMLDRLCSMKEAKERYGERFGAYTEACERLEAVRASAASRDRDLDLLAHQIRELERVRLDADAYAAARDDERRLANAERLYASVSSMVALLGHDEPGAGEKISSAFGPLKTLVATDPSTAEFAKQLERIQAEHGELLAALESYREDLAFEPDEAAAIRERADGYTDVLRKYGPTIEDAAGLYREVKERHDLLVNLEHNDAELTKELAAIEKELAGAASKITRERKRAGEALKGTIEKELKDLGISRVAFEARIERADYTADGRDAVTFYISPNAGEELKPLAAIVSSGEAARVMLALKKALIKVDPIPTLIFDEIDAQIGGRLGAVIGRKVRELASARQVILITHLPQIASFADSHYIVTKGVQKGRTVTHVSCLDRTARVEELTKMMAGGKETAVARAHAEEMLAKALTPGR